MLCDHFIIFPHFHERLHIKLALIDRAVSEKKMFKNNGFVHYSGAGTDSPRNPNAFKT